MKQNVRMYFGIVLAGCFLMGCKPPLTKLNAVVLIPNGMSEVQVAELLGTNAVITTDTQKRKYLWYFFKFLPPEHVSPKIDSIMIVISNEVVIDRRFENPPSL